MKDLIGDWSTGEWVNQLADELRSKEMAETIKYSVKPQQVRLLDGSTFRATIEDLTCTSGQMWNEGYVTRGPGQRIKVVMQDGIFVEEPEPLRVSSQFQSMMDTLLPEKDSKPPRYFGDVVADFDD